MLYLFVMYQSGTQPVYSCLKLAVETLEEGVKFQVQSSSSKLKVNKFEVNNIEIRTTQMASFWYLYCKLRIHVTPCLMFLLLTLNT